MRALGALPEHDTGGFPENEPLVRLAELTAVLSAADEPSALFETAERALAELFDPRELRLYRLDAVSGALSPIDWRSGRPDEPEAPEPGGALAALLESGLARFAEGAAGDPPIPVSGAEDGDVWFALPLTAGTALEGVFVAVLRGSRSFTREDRLVLHAVADLLAVGLQRIRRRAESERLAVRMSGLEEQMAERDGLFAQMLSVVAHEMRTPLTAIKAYAETLLDAPPDPGFDPKPFLAIINDECDRLGRLLSNALDYSRLESGRRSLHLTTIAPSDLLQDVVLTLGPESQKRQVTLVSEVPESLDPIEGDPDLLKQLCINLIGNAIKFSPEEGTVRLAVTECGEEWRLDVLDRGAGIPEDQREQIFERFYRAEVEGVRGVPGTGLGLAIARGITELHGGRLWVAANPDGGSIFSVRLPRVQRAPETSRRAAEALWETDARSFLEEAVGAVSDLMDAGIVSIMVVDPEAGDLRVAASVGLEDHARRRRVSYRGGIAGRALADGQPVLVNDIEADPRFRRPNHPQYNTKSLLCMPLALDGDFVGVVNVNNKRSHEEFTEDDLVHLARLTEKLAGAVERAGAALESKAVYSEGLASLQAAGRRDRELVPGESSAAAYAVRVARRLGASAEAADALAGLIARREECAAAGVAETATVAGPTEPGANGGANESAVLGRPGEILSARDERWDGDGSPRGLAGEEIPLGARILAVVDAFHEWTRGRSYRTALSAEEALRALQGLAGRRFDPRVVEALAALVAETGVTLAAPLPGPSGSPGAPAAPEPAGGAPGGS